MCNFYSGIILKIKTVLAPVFNQSHICSNMKNFGKTVFLTKEEAEAALAEMEAIVKDGEALGITFEKVKSEV